MVVRRGGKGKERDTTEGSYYSCSFANVAGKMVGCNAWGIRK